MTISDPSARVLCLAGRVAITGFILFVAGCGRPATEVEKGNREQVLHVGNFIEPSDLDPHIITRHQELQIALGLFEGLTRYDPENSQPLPGVAERWEVSADGLVWRFQLRPGARWSNGDAVTARDFEFAYRRMLNPALAAEYASLLYVLRNAREMKAGRLADPAQLGVRAEGERVLVLQLAHPTPHLPTMLCHPAWSPLHRPALEKHGALEKRGTVWARPGNLIGNGPFVLADWKPQQFVRLEPNPHYWDRAKVRLRAAVYHAIDSEDAEERAYRTGRLHLTSGVPISRLASYRAAGSPDLRSSVYLATFFLRFNAARPPFDDVRVRRALSLSIDREQIVRNVLKGNQTAAGNLTPPGTAGFTSRSQVGFDPAAARASLREAGYGEGKPFPTVEYLFNSSEANRLLAEALQQMWRTNLGVTVELRNHESRAHLEAMRTGEFQIARFAWTGDYLDPGAFLELLTGDSSNNMTRWRDPGYDRAFAEATATADPARRFDLFQRCEEILARECPVAPIYFYTRNNLRRPEVVGWHGTLLDMHPPREVWLDSARAK